MNVLPNLLTGLLTGHNQKFRANSLKIHSGRISRQEAKMQRINTQGASKPEEYPTP